MPLVNAPGYWIDYSPSWTNLSVGNGTVTARYTQIGKTIHFHVELVWGGTTSITGTPRATLPVVTSANYKQFTSIIGHAGYFDTSSGAVTVGLLWWYDNDEMWFDVQNAASTYTGGTNVSSTVPWTWATGDRMAVSGSYEAA